MTLEFDDVLLEVGDYDLYQKVLYIILCLPASFPCAWSAFNHFFTTVSPMHWCHLPNLTSSLHVGDIVDDRNIHFVYDDIDGVESVSQCRRFLDATTNYTNATVGCIDGYDYDLRTYKSTVVTEWDLVCEEKELPIVCMTVFYVGSFLGNFLFGWIADKYGRRFSFFIILGLLVIVGTISAFSVNMKMYIATRFLVGLTFPALYQIPFIIGMELMGPNGRIFAGLVVSSIFAIAMTTLGLVASLAREWRTLTLICNAPFAILFVYWWILPESPRWLVCEGRIEEAKRVLLKVAKVNKREVDPGYLHEWLDEVHRGDNDQNIQYGIRDLFRTANLRKKVIIVSFVWVVNAVVYNGLTMNTSNLGVNDYYAFAINGAVEIPAYVLIWPLLDRLGRRWMLSTFMLLGGVACVACTFVPEDQPWTLCGLAFFGKFSNAASFAIIYIFAGELYPTVVRALAMGFSSMIAGIGLLLVPYLISLSALHRILPLLIMGCLMVTAGVASMFLPETLRSPLPMTIEDAESYGRGFTFCYFPKKTTINRRPSCIQLDDLNNHTPHPKESTDLLTVPQMSP